MMGNKVLKLIIVLFICSCAGSVIKTSKNGEKIEGFDGLNYLTSEFSISSNQVSSDGSEFFAVDTKERSNLGSKAVYRFKFKISGNFTNSSDDDITIAKWDSKISEIDKKFPSTLSIYYSQGRIFGMVKSAIKRKYRNNPQKTIFFKQSIELNKWYEVEVETVWENVKQDSEIEMKLYDEEVDGSSFFKNPVAKSKYKGPAGSKSSYGPKFKIGVWDKSWVRNHYNISFKEIYY